MPSRTTSATAVMLALLVGSALARATAQGSRASFASADHPAIAYRITATTDAVAGLNRSLADGRVHLTFDPATGYLRSVLDALGIPIESQIAVFTKTSLQSPIIAPGSPRVLYFNDSVVVGAVRGGFIEAAAQDPRQGVIFYNLAQAEVPDPAFQRRDTCRSCHETRNALDVPGLFVRSLATSPSGAIMPWLANNAVDHRTPFADRWGGWYVTGRAAALSHLGNTTFDPAGRRDPAAAVTLDSLKEKFDTAAYLSPYSDIAALITFEHQIRMINLMTRMGWETRVALHQPDGQALPPGAVSVGEVLRASVPEFVDYLLFVDEAPLPGRVESTSGFTGRFEGRGPRDRQGRSLRQFDLERRLFRYPCSYLIYSEAFDALPDVARDAIYRRMWEILSGADTAPKYARLTPGDRKAIVEILRDTKKSLPDYFRP